MAYFENKQFMKTVKQARLWTDEQDAQLKQLCKTDESVFEVARTLDKHPFAVILRMRFLSGYESRNAKGTKPKDFYDQNVSLQGLYPERMQKWSDSDNAILRNKFHNGENLFTLAAHFRRSPLAILMHLQELYHDKRDMSELYKYTKQFMGRTRIVYQKEEVKKEVPQPKAEPIEASQSGETDWEAYTEEQKKLFPNHGTPWTEEDEQLLTILVTKKECSIDTLSRVFKKNHNAIQRKLERMQLYTYSNIKS